MLDIARTREELERSWFEISQDIDLADAQDQVMQLRNYAN